VKVLNLKYAHPEGGGWNCSVDFGDTITLTTRDARVASTIIFDAKTFVPRTQVMDLGDGQRMAWEIKTARASHVKDKELVRFLMTENTQFGDLVGTLSREHARNDLASDYHSWYDVVARAIDRLPAAEKKEIGARFEKAVTAMGYEPGARKPRR
jgi:hypothetical protein